MRKRKGRGLLLCLALFMGLIAPAGPISAADDPSINLIPNGGFEESKTTTRNQWVNNIEPVGWAEWYPSGKPKAAVDQEVYHEGKQSVRIDAPTSSRGSIGITVNVTPGKSYKFSAWMKTRDVVSASGVFIRTQYLTSGGAKISDGPRTDKLDGTQDWTLREFYMTLPANASKLKIEPFLETGTGTAWFDDLQLVEWDGMTGLEIDPSALSMEIGGVSSLTAKIIPSGASSKPILWSSSNEEVATVERGIVSAHAEGTAVIRAATEDGRFAAESKISVELSETTLAYKQIRNKWYAKLTGGDAVDLSDSDTAAYIAQLADSVRNEGKTGLWDSMNKGEGRSSLWNDLSSTTDPYQFGDSYSRLRTMALAYSIKGSVLYKDEALKQAIIDGMDWMYANRFNERAAETGNWYVWEISMPRTLNDLMVLMYDDLSPEQLQSYLRAFDRFLPDPTKRTLNGVPEVGANLLDKAFNVVLRGVIGKSADKIMQGSAPIGNEYKYTESGDGVYRDGSVVQHFYVAYTGGYGGDWLMRSADVNYLLHESPWPITDPDFGNVYDWVIDAFEPIIYNGLSMDMVNGRGISRPGGGSAKSMILAILQLSDTAPGEQSLAFKRMVKEWILNDKEQSYIQDVSLYEMQRVKDLLNDSSIAPRGELVKHHVFAGMDRVVHLRPEFGLGISMFSDRISAFEYGNTENKNGWYTGIGMTSLYNRDLAQYRDGYWATVDSFRLAGTTTDRSGEGKTPGEWAKYPNTKIWVGGSSLEGLYGATGMDFSLSKVTGSSLSGRKSWFSFDDEVVALGSDITSADNKAVETIVENRKLNSAGDNTLTVNGIKQDSELGWTESLHQVKWAHLAGNVPGSDIGYYFPETAELKGLREARTGSFYDINKSVGTTDPLTRNYLSLAFEHGVKPNKADYAYVLLPGKDAAATARYNDDPQIEIISHTSEVHAVQEKRLGITAANFWQAGTASFITANQPLSVMVQEKNGELTIAVSDPTQSQQKVTLSIAKEGYVLAGKDSTVNLLDSPSGVLLEVNTAGSLGATHSITLRSEAETAADTVTLTAADTVVVPGGTAGVEMGLSHLSKPAVAEDITISYDAAALTFMNVEEVREGLAVIHTDTSVPGQLRLILASMGAEQAIVGEGALLKLVFQASSEAAPGPSEIRIKEAVLADGAGEETMAQPAALILEIKKKDAGVPGDVNGDGKVSIGDLAIIASHYGKHAGSPDWNEAKIADINGDGKVDLSDLVIVANKVLE